MSAPGALLPYRSERDRKQRPPLVTFVSPPANVRNVRNAAVTACAKAAVATFTQQLRSVLGDIARKVSPLRNDDRRGKHDVGLDTVALPPEEKLRDAIDLIVVTAIGKGEKLGEEFGQPGRVLEEADVTRFELCSCAAMPSSLPPSGLMPIGRRKPGDGEQRRS